MAERGHASTRPTIDWVVGIGSPRSPSRIAVEMLVRYRGPTQNWIVAVSCRGLATLLTAVTVLPTLFSAWAWHVARSCRAT
jgi:hypothetical protein